VHCQPLTLILKFQRVPGISLRTAEITALSNFIEKYPQGKNAREARARASAVEEEQSAWLSAERHKNLKELQAYVSRYPNGEYVKYANAEIAKLQEEGKSEELEKRKIAQLLQAYESAYNEKNLDRVASLWPSLSVSARKRTRSLFKDAQSVKLSLKVLAEPTISGTTASVVCERTRDITTSDRIQSHIEGTVTFKLVKQSGGWLILDGAM
jgi:hypothetical protein